MPPLYRRGNRGMGKRSNLLMVTHRRTPIESGIDLTSQAPVQVTYCATLTFVVEAFGQGHNCIFVTQIFFKKWQETASKFIKFEVERGLKCL